MNKICFCYSGEGAMGSIQAGITKSLIDKGIKPDLTIGVFSGKQNISVTLVQPEELIFESTEFSKCRTVQHT